MGDLIAGLGILLFVIVVIALIAGISHVAYNWWWKQR